MKHKNEISILQKPHYTGIGIGVSAIFGGSGSRDAHPGNNLLLENGDNFLLETGDALLFE